MTDSFDVLIVGAGPAGSRVACRLASLGYKTAVFEAQPLPGNKKICTGIIGRECKNRFPYGDDCAKKQVNSARLFAPSGDSIRISREDVQADVVDRNTFDLSLAHKAQKKGAKYFLSSKVTDISISSHSVEAKINRDGEYKNVSADVVVIACGFGSDLPSKIGLGKIKDFMVGAQAEVEINGIDEIEVYFGRKTAPGFFAWLVPMSGNKARVGLLSERQPGEYLKRLLIQLRAEGKINSVDPAIFHGGIPLKPLPKTYGERVLVLGDAAGQVKPTTGGGIYYGLISADLAAETIHQCFLANDFSAKTLSKYEKAWKSKLGRELKIGYFAHRVLAGISDKRFNSLFRVVKNRNIHRKLLDSENLSFDWHSGVILEGLKLLNPWHHLLTKKMPAYISSILRR